jgi:uncharacterized protein YjiS (DUF1127 family)
MKRYSASRLPGIRTLRYSVLEVASDAVIGLVGVLFRWQERTTERQCLGQLDGHLLEYIGVSPFDARRQSRKPFWRS